MATIGLRRPLPTLLLLLFCLQGNVVIGINDGLALTPPMGWRSWNLYEGDINQEKMESIMRGMVRRHSRPDHTGRMTTLAELGYRDVGLDDLWQDCHSTEAAEGMHYHDSNGVPLIDKSRFPSIQNMTAFAHSLNLTAGWYANNCACNDQCRNITECKLQIQGDVQALVAYNFDGIKIDGCGNETSVGLAHWYETIRRQRRRTTKRHNKIVIENCHGVNPDFKPNWTLPPPFDCPYHFYRTSHDIRNTYGSIVSNLETLPYYHHRNDSRPGCWAYPDMLMVGVDHGDGYGLNLAETRSHFGAWAVVSSPLILSHNVNNHSVMDRIWDLISNRLMIHINQVYVGDSGGRYYQSSEKVRFHVGGNIWDDIPAVQYLSKPIGDDKLAVFLMNSGKTTRSLLTDFRTIPHSVCGCCRIQCSYRVYNVWDHRSKGIHEGSYSVQVLPHDAAFLLLEPNNHGTTDKN